ncbi:SRPBCC family protein [Rhodococcus sp. NPDC058521]|uniref:SRPBCC family protein n=1 Tax=Rhodococcus sp. NPDC058521 TaxID=3346536 RepID=UPI0036521229
MTSRHVSQVIECSPETLYEFAVDPSNLPKWAAGLASAEVVREGDTLLVDSPMGRVTVRFTARNDLGVLDHDVTLPSGEKVNNPVRVLAHPEGCEIVFTVRQLDLSDEEFERDTRTVAEDLERLKTLLTPTVSG